LPKDLSLFRNIFSTSFQALAELHQTNCFPGTCKPTSSASEFRWSHENPLRRTHGKPS
jgi:hypothetical protein